MKNFNQKGYAQTYQTEISAKIPGYQVMFDLLFKGVLPVEFQNSPEKILLVGGGEIEVKGLATLFPEANYTLIDTSEEMLAYVRESIKKQPLDVTYVHQSIETYSQKQTYQLIFCLLVLHFIAEKEEFLGKLYDVLDQEGILILSAFSTEQIEWWQSFAISSGANQAEVNHTFSNQESLMKSVSPLEIERIAQRIGFRRIEKIAHLFSVDLWLLQK